MSASRFDNHPWEVLDACNYPTKDNGICFIGISAQNPVFSVASLSRIFESMIKAGFTKIVFLETSDLYKYTLEANLQIQKSLAGKNTHASQQEHEQNEYKTQRRSTQIINKCMTAVFKSTSLDSGFKFLLASDSAEKKSSDQSEWNCDLALGDLRRTLEEKGYSIISNQIRRNDAGLYSLPSPLPQDTAILAASQKFNKMQHEVLEKRIEHLPIENLLDTLLEEKNIVVFCQWHEIKKLPLAAFFRKHIEKQLRNDNEALNEFNNLVALYSEILVNNQLDRDHVKISPKTQKALQNQVKSYEELFLTEEMAIIEMLKYSITQNNNLFAFCYPYLANTLGALIFKLSSHLGGLEGREHIDITYTVNSVLIEKYLSSLSGIGKASLRLISEYAGFCRSPLTSKFAYTPGLFSMLPQAASSTLSSGSPSIDQSSAP